MAPALRTAAETTGEPQRLAGAAEHGTTELGAQGALTAARLRMQDGGVGLLHAPVFGAGSACKDPAPGHGAGRSPGVHGPAPECLAGAWIVRGLEIWGMQKPNHPGPYNTTEPQP